MSSVRWFRVCSRPQGENGAWMYGWVFSSDSLLRAEKTIKQVCSPKDTEAWEYWLKEVDSADFDHPERSVGRE